jgi:hypothetical protein
VNGDLVIPDPTYAPADAHLHDPTDHPNFNESEFFHFVDDATDLAILVRIGNRVNEGHAETTILVMGPGTGGAFNFARVPIASNTEFEAGGLRFEVLEPLRRMRVTFDGQLRRLSALTELEDPKRVFTEAPTTHLALDLEYEVLTEPYGVGTLQGSAGTATLSAEHYQVPCAARGVVTTDGEARAVTGHGFHDHSWGPRQWQRPQYWRWVSAIVDADNWFEGFTWKIDDVRQPDFGRLCRDGVLQRVDRVDFTSTYGGSAPHYPESVAMTLHTADRAVDVTGELVHLAPLRHRSGDEVARITEKIFRCRFDGLEALGFSEYHDQIIDGAPHGMGEV